MGSHIQQVEELTLSQEDALRTHSTQREIAGQVGISVASVNTVIKKDLHLKCLKRRKAQELTESNKLARRERCQRLLKHYPASLVTLFGLLMKSCSALHRQPNAQNDHLYAPFGTLKKDIPSCRLLRTRATFSESGGISRHICAWSYQCSRCWSRNKDQWPHWPVLPQSTVASCCQKCEFSEFFIFQQEGAPAHRAWKAVTHPSTNRARCRNCGPAQSRNTGLHLSKSVAAKTAQTSIP